MTNFFAPLVFSLVALAGCSLLTLPHPAKFNRWAVYYDHTLPASTFKDMDLVVFDRVYYPDFNELQGRTLVLAYVSIGELAENAPEKAMLKKKKAILYQNDKWKSYVIDTTLQVWQDMVLKTADDAAKKGFDGVMLDTADSPLEWAKTNKPERLNEIHASLVQIIHNIRLAHPDKLIMVNRGFNLIEDISVDIDFILAESIFDDANVSTGQFALFSSMTYTQAATQLHHAVAFAPHLQIFTLDYWNQDDVNGLERIYAAHRARGFVPYVTTPDLRHFTPEP